MLQNKTGSHLPQTKKSLPIQGRLFFGPSDRVRTCGLMVPNHPRYQLRYTRIHRNILSQYALLYEKNGVLSSRKIVRFTMGAYFARAIFILSMKCGKQSHHVLLSLYCSDDKMNKN
jgi:hypothetical protein